VTLLLVAFYTRTRLDIHECYVFVVYTSIRLHVFRS